MRKLLLLSLALLFSTIGAYAQNDAQFISQTAVPTQLDPGEQFTVSITMKNTGTTTWIHGTGNVHKLGSQNPQDNNNWNVGGRLYLSYDVAPGEEYTFTQTFTAPSVNGIYNFQWEMLEEGLVWFGDFTQNVEILVSNYSLVGTTIPTSDQCYQLTDTAADCGAVWYKDKIDLRNPFDINFTLDMQNLQNNGADGMMFVLQNESDSALGNAGGSLGYNGIGTRSMGVEFDVYNNRTSCGLGNWPDDPPYDSWNGPEPADCSDHIAISRNGNVLCEIASPISMFDDPTQTIEDDTIHHQVRIKWDPNTDSIHVYLDCELRIAVEYDIIDSIFQGENLVYWGFTGSTGPWDYDKIEVCLDGNIFTALEDRTICKGTSVEIDVQGATYGNPTWSPNYNIDDIYSSSPTVNPLVDTTYYLSYTHPECGDSRIDSVHINVNNPTATISGGGEICDDGSTSDIILDFTGGPGISYGLTLNGNSILTDTSSSSQITFPYSEAGTYLVSNATDTLGCTAIISGSAQIIINPLPQPNISGNLSFCNNDSSTLDAGTYNSYLWSTGETAQTITVSNSGQYIVTVTDSHTCNNTDTVQVTVNPLPVISITALPDTEICFGDSVKLDASSSTGAGNLQYLWSNYSDSVITDVLPANDTTFYLVVTDTNLCQNTDSVQIVVNELPYFDSALIVDVTNCITHNGEITLNAAGGTAPYNFNINGSSFSSVNHWDTLNSIVYTYGVLDDKGCAYYQNYAIPNTSGLYIDTVTYNPILCFGDTTHIIVTPSVNGNIYYSVDTPITYVSDSIFTNIYAGDFFINIIDSTTNCEAGYPLTISEPEQLSLIGFANPTICDTANGSAWAIVTGGTSGYNYNWSNTSINNDTITNLSAGNYSLTVVDYKLCKDSVNFVVEDFSTGTLQIDSITDVACFGDSSAIIYSSILGGNPNYNYYWYADTNLISSVTNATNSNSLINIPTGYYTLQVIDNLGCTSSVDSIFINQPLALNLTYQLNPILCYNDTTGSIISSVSGGVLPYNYLWSTSNNDTALYNLQEGTYSLTVTDNNNCLVKVEDINLINPDELIMSINSIQNLNCYQSNDGEINMSVYGGTPDYTIFLNNDEVSDTIFNNLSAGTYTILVSDNNQCTKADTVELLQPSELISYDTVYYDRKLGNIIINVNGGTPDYNYVWSNGETDSTNFNLETGDYTVTITDKNNCEIVYTYNIETPMLIPTVITPNADGFNDTWEIIGIKAYNNIKIHIFNRWGDSVYEFQGSGIEYKDRTIQWNGMWEGKELPLGTYVYILEIDDTNESYNGTVTIVR